MECSYHILLSCVYKITTYYYYLCLTYHDPRAEPLALFNDIHIK
jgi:hypothetical protein